MPSDPIKSGYFKFICFGFFAVLWFLQGILRSVDQGKKSLVPAGWDAL